MGFIRLLKAMKINQCKQGDKRKRKARSLKPRRLFGFESLLVKIF
jgi:hypothetical protein